MLNLRYLSFQTGKDPALQNHRMLVLEAAPKGNPMTCAPEEYSNRVSSITPGTRKLLEGKLFSPSSTPTIKSLSCTELEIHIK